MRWILILMATALAAQPGQPGQRSGEALQAAMEKQKAAAAQQREAARKQMENLGVWLIPGRADTAAGPAGQQGAAALDTGPKAGCDAIPEALVAPLIEGAARAQSLQFKLLHAVIDQESRFHPCAVSPKGAKGMMQLMPDTAGDLGVSDPFDPKENIEAGARYLRQMLDKYKGDLAQALGAYNAGPAAVDQAGGVPNIRETRDYVNAILQKVGTTRIDPPNIPMPKPIEN